MEYKSIVGRRQFYRRIQKHKERILRAFSDAGCTDDQHLGNTDNCNLYTFVESNNYCDIENESQDINSNVDVNSSNGDDSPGDVDEPELSSNNNLYTSPVYIDSNYDLTLSDKLKRWAISSSSTHSSVTKLLHILSFYHPELPKDCRTLLQTPIKMTIVSLETGNYCHLGLKDALESFLLMHSDFDSDFLNIAFNIDGIPLYKSTNSQIWPILAQVKNYKSKPFPIGIFYGTSKPKPLELFLRDFIFELKSLTNDDLLFKGKRFKVKIFGFICDAPARAFIKCIKHHAGYSSCEKCLQTGEYVDGRVVFESVCASKRTNSAFNQQLDDDHHTGVSPLQDLPIGMITNFPIDYMHNVCLGVVKKMLNSWLNGPLQVRMRNSVVKDVSKTLESFKKFIPAEFNRKPRSLSELPRWKATELRTFLLYLGPLVLKKVDLAIYEHFLLLHCAITILVSERHIAKFEAKFADKLLQNFVRHSTAIYGNCFLIYNVHYLTHLSDDVEMYGALDNFSAFPFETYLNEIKRLVKSTTNPLAEIYNRLTERNIVNKVHNSLSNKKIEFKLKHNTGPLIDIQNLCEQYRKVECSNFILSTIYHSEADCYCMIQKSVIQILNILHTSEDKMLIVGKKFCSYFSLYTYPFKSEVLNIYLISGLSHTLDLFEFDDEVVKCLVIPSADQQWMCFPLIHSIN